MKQPPWYQGRLWNGIGLSAWLRLLAKNRFAVSPSRWPQALATSVLSVTNSTLGAWQRVRFGAQIRDAKIDPDPVFIIGHWRTGTTLLHELLALDPANRCPTTLESLSPHHFLCTEKHLKRWLWFTLPKTRPMDNMRVGWEKPQEDEVALALLGAPSTFLTVAFPNRPLQDPDYVTLESLAANELDQWKSVFLRYLKSLLVKRQGQLVLKSPQHTFRLKVLTEMFPRARFIYMARDPRSVIPSTEHFWWSMYCTHGLQVPRKEGLEEFVLKTFAAMHEQYERTRGLVDPARLHELRYEELVADPVAEVRKIYERFEWPTFSVVEPELVQYAARSKRYQTNQFEVTPELSGQVAKWCEAYCVRFRYQGSGVRGAVTGVNKIGNHLGE